MNTQIGTSCLTVSWILHTIRFQPPFDDLGCSWAVCHPSRLIFSNSHTNNYKRYMPDILRETNVCMYDTSLVLQVGFPYRTKTCKVIDRDLHLVRRKSRKELGSEKTPLAGSEGPNLGTLSAQWTTSLEERGGTKGERRRETWRGGKFLTDA